MLTLHLLAAIMLGGFILTDRFILRRAFAQKELKILYRNALAPTAIAAAILIISGLYMIQNTSIHYLKASFGLITVALFFLCPIINAAIGKKARFIYRAITLAMLIATVCIAKSI
jgi:hypothetical protein